MKNILVVGLGSIGRRHTENFAKFFEEVDIVDINPERINQAKEKFNINESFDDFNFALNNKKYDVVAITTPPHLHLKISKLAAKKGSHLFIEKPLGMNADGWKEVSKICKKNNLKSYVAYCHRHINFTKKLKEIIDSNELGNVIHANMNWGSYLPDWHPYEDYRSFYMAKKEQGGGALLDESHGVDLIRYVFGDIKEVFGVVDKISELQISSDDVAFLTLKTNSNVLVHANFDLVARAPRCNFEIICSEGTLIWDRIETKIKKFSSESKNWISIDYSMEDVMNMYPKQAEYFMESLKNSDELMNNIDDAIQTQKVLDASFISSSTKKVVVIE